MMSRLLLSTVLCFALAAAVTGCSMPSNEGSGSRSSNDETVESVDRAIAKAMKEPITEASERASDIAINGPETTPEAPANGTVKGTVEKEPQEPESESISLGQSVQNDDFSITLLDARVDSTLQSDESRTYWEPEDGTAFVILELDVTAQNSNQLPVDDYAITDLCANYNDDTYQNWQLQYLASELWLSFHHTYLDANIPTHVYAYTTIPAKALNEGTLSVDVSLAGKPCNIAIR